ncbi:hypothetical protein BC826DRAFT_545507 [Russula brevipes]|nr:hypothetical protein BC826DRAFT_545507 [Russula brevipes]
MGWDGNGNGKGKGTISAPTGTGSPLSALCPCRPVSRAFTYFTAGWNASKNFYPSSSCVSRNANAQSSCAPLLPLPSTHNSHRLSPTHMPSTTLLPSSSDFKAHFSTAMSDYTGQTRTDLVNHPLTAAIKNCHTQNAVLDILQERAQALNGSRKGDATLIKWLRPTVDCLFALSINQALSGSASLLFMPARIVLSGIGILFEAAKDVKASYDSLLDLLEHVEGFSRRLMVYTKTPLTPNMVDILVNILIELSSVVTLMTKQIRQGQLSASIPVINRLLT